MMKNFLILFFIFICGLFYAQYFPFKNENNFDVTEFIRIRDSLISNPQKNTGQTVKEEGVFYDNKDGTNIIMQYSKDGGGLLQITKGSHWIVYSYFKNLQLRSKRENMGRYYATGIWKEFDENGKLLKEEDMDLMYDDRPEYIDKKVKLISIREIAEKLKVNFQKKMFDDVNFYDFNMIVDEETNRWVYRIVFTDSTKKDTVEFFDYDAHNGQFVKNGLLTIPDDLDLY